jgi:hypothetical protein
MRARLVLVPLVLAAALLTGCTTTKATPGPAPTTAKPDNGVAALSADEILSKAKTALSAASSFRIKGDMTESDGTKTTVDLTVAKNGDGKGTFATSGLSFEIIKVGTDVYVKASEDFWKTFIPEKQQAAALLLLKGRYVKADATQAQFSSFGTVFDVNEMLKPEGTFTKGDVSTVNGTEVIALIDSKNNDKLYIATHGDPYPVRMESGPSSGADFSDINGTADIKAPSADQILDLKSLMGLK